MPAVQKTLLTSGLSMESAKKKVTMAGMTPSPRRPIGETLERAPPQNETPEKRAKLINTVTPGPGGKDPGIGTTTPMDTAEGIDSDNAMDLSQDGKKGKERGKNPNHIDLGNYEEEKEKDPGIRDNNNMDTTNSPGVQDEMDTEEPTQETTEDDFTEVSTQQNSRTKQKNRRKDYTKLTICANNGQSCSSGITK